MASWVEGLRHGTIRRQAPLRLSGGCEPLHAPLPLPGRLMRVCRAIVAGFVLPMCHARQPLTLGGGVALQFIGHWAAAPRWAHVPPPGAALGGRDPESAGAKRPFVFPIRPVKIRVTVRVHGDEIIIDFLGSDPQVRDSVNTNFAITMSAVYYCIRTLAREPFPFNYGCIAPVKIIADAGCVVNCIFPSAVAGGNVETSQRIVDVVLGALHKAVPDRVAAAWAR